jgi:hypothetical protein
MEGTVFIITAGVVLLIILFLIYIIDSSLKGKSFTKRNSINWNINVPHMKKVFFIHIGVVIFINAVAFIILPLLVAFVFSGLKLPVWLTVGGYIASLFLNPLSTTISFILPMESFSYIYIFFKFNILDSLFFAYVAELVLINRKNNNQGGFGA